MNEAMTIKEFHTLLTSEKDSGSLPTALRELRAIEKTEDIVTTVKPTGFYWHSTPDD